MTSKKTLFYFSLIFIVLFFGKFINISNATPNNIPPISVEFNGTPVDFGIKLYIKNDRVMVPITKFAELLGSSVKKDPLTGSEIIIQDGNEITIISGEQFATVNGEIIYLDAPSESSQNFTFVPLRFVIENLGANVIWVAETRTVEVRYLLRNPEIIFKPIDMEVFTLSTLRLYDGKYGRPSYIVFNGNVYDVTTLPEWKFGKCEGYEAGNDLTIEFSLLSPHLIDLLTEDLKIGILKDPLIKY